MLLIHAPSHVATGRFHTVSLPCEGGSRSGPWWPSVWAPRVFCLNFGPRSQRVELVRSLTSAVDGLLSALTLGRLLPARGRTAGFSSQGCSLGFNRGQGPVRCVLRSFRILTLPPFHSRGKSHHLPKVTYLSKSEVSLSRLCLL